MARRTPGLFDINRAKAWPGVDEIIGAEQEFTMRQKMQLDNGPNETMRTGALDTLDDHASVHGSHRGNLASSVVCTEAAPTLISATMKQQEYRLGTTMTTGANLRRKNLTPMNDPLDRITSWAMTPTAPVVPMMPGNIPSSIDLSTYHPPKTYFSGSCTAMSNPSYIRGQRKAQRKFEKVKPRLDIMR